MKSILLVIGVLLVTNVLSHEKVLSISYANSEKVHVFKDNKRVRIRLAEGGKLNGKLQIINEEQIKIRNVIIPISNIEKIKNNPLSLNIVVSGLIVATGSYLVLGGLAIIVWGGAGIGLATIAVGAGTITAGILSPNFLAATHINQFTNIKVVQLME